MLTRLLAAWHAHAAPSPGPEPEPGIRIPVDPGKVTEFDLTGQPWFWPVISAMAAATIVVLFWGALKKHPIWLMAAGGVIVVLGIIYFG